MATLSDLFSDYPLLSDPNFAGKIAAKKEFKELKLDMEQNIVENEGLFKSQLFVKRMLAPHSTVNEQLVIHDVGTGKTCAATAVAEAYKNALKGVGKKRALVVVKGKTIEDSFKDNLTKYCTKNIYTVDEEKQYVQAGKRAVITKKINEFYDIIHYVALAKDIAKLSDDKVREKYSDRVIIFDESHNLRMGYFSKSKKDSDLVDKEMIKWNVYDNIHRMLHLAKRRKVILLSATPVVDKIEEFALQLNLLLPLNKQITNDIIDWNNPSIEVLEPYFRGLISYVKSSTNVAKAIEKGSVLDIPDPFNEIEDIRIVLTTSKMSEYQYRQYLKYRGVESIEVPQDEEEINENYTDSSSGKGAIRRNERSASMFAFPPSQAELIEIDKIKRDTTLSNSQKDAKINYILDRLDTVSSSAFSSRFAEKRGVYYFIDKSLSESINRGNLKEFSCVFDKIISICKSNPDELAFVFTEFVTGPGAILLGLCFEQNGYSRYDGITAFKSKAKKGKGNEEDDENINTIQKEISLQPARRYALITGLTSTADRQNTLDLFRHPDNKYGDYIQVLIGSSVTKEGISLRNIRQVHIAHPFWNDVPLEQARGRAFREGVHNDLPIQERYVKVYQHAAIAPDKYNGDEVEDPFATIDVEMYGISEGKRKKISKILRIAKRCATDCVLNKVRNQDRPNTRDNTRECDYDTCKYTCVGSEVDAKENTLDPLDEDDSSYFLYYSDSYLRKLTEKIKKLFSINNSFTLDEIIDRLKLDERENKYVVKTLSLIINNNEPIVNDFGKILYLKKSGNNYFLQDNITLNDKSLTYYSSSLFNENYGTLEEFVKPLKEKKKMSALDKIYTLNPLSEEFIEKIIKSPIDVKAKLLENALTANLIDPESQKPMDMKILEIFGNRYYGYRNIEKDENLIFHDLFTKEIDDSSGKYAVTTRSQSKIKYIRIISDKTRTWRYVTETEATKYYAEMEAIDNERRDEFKSFDYYGSISTDDYKFRILDNKTLREKETKPGKTDKRERFRGAVCSDYPQKKNLIDIIKYLELVPSNEVSEVADGLSKEDMVSSKSMATGFKKVNFDDWTFEEVRYYYIWNTLKKEKLCELIQAEMRRKGILIYQ